MSKNSLKISSEGYPIFIKLADFIVINSLLISSAHLFAMVPIETMVMLSLLFSVFFLLFAEYTKMYQQKIKTMNLLSQKRLLLSTLLSLLFIEIVRITLSEPRSLGYLSALDPPFCSAIIFWYLIPLPFLYYVRFFIFRYSARKKIRVAIIGLSDNGLAAESALMKEYDNITLDLAFYDERGLSRCSDFVDRMKSPFRGPVNNLIEEAKRGKIDEVYIALPMVALYRIRHFLSIMSDTTVDTYILPDFYTYSNNMSKLRSINNLQTVGVFISPFEGVGFYIKRAQDLVLGSIIMMLISIPMLAIAIGIKFTSRGPVFFKQDRYGLSGQKINVWKFRTMRVMENADEVIQATKNDPRVTRFGRFLRRTSLDELPQFLNVLQGSMSIVGPRPHAVAHNELYRKQVENYMIRHKVKPGITGLAQINGYRGEIDALHKMEKRVQYDIDYIQNWSLWLDIKIIIKTIFKGFVSKNAY